MNEIVFCLASSMTLTTSAAVSTCSRETTPTTIAEEDEDEDRWYLGTEEVIEETITLLAKLETDRQETLKTLTEERKRTGKLRQSIDDMAVRRLLDLPEYVQKGDLHHSLLQTSSKNLAAA